MTGLAFDSLRWRLGWIFFDSPAPIVSASFLPGQPVLVACAEDIDHTMGDGPKPPPTPMYNFQSL